MYSLEITPPILGFLLSFRKSSNTERQIQSNVGQLAKEIKFRGTNITDDDIAIESTNQNKEVPIGPSLISLECTYHIVRKKEHLIWQKALLFTQKFTCFRTLLNIAQQSLPSKSSSFS